MLLYLTLKTVLVKNFSQAKKEGKATRKQGHIDSRKVCIKKKTKIALLEVGLDFFDDGSFKATTTGQWSDGRAQFKVKK